MGHLGLHHRRRATVYALIRSEYQGYNRAPGYCLGSGKWFADKQRCWYNALTLAHVSERRRKVLSRGPPEPLRRRPGYPTRPTSGRSGSSSRATSCAARTASTTCSCTSRNTACSPTEAASGGRPTSLTRGLAGMGRRSLHASGSGTRTGTSRPGRGSLCRGVSPGPNRHALGEPHVEHVSEEVGAGRQCRQRRRGLRPGLLPLHLR